jgi:hypothetical protein
MNDALTRYSPRLAPAATAAAHPMGDQIWDNSSQLSALPALRWRLPLSRLPEPPLPTPGAYEVKGSVTAASGGAGCPVKGTTVHGIAAWPGNTNRNFTIVLTPAPRGTTANAISYNFLREAVPDLTQSSNPPGPVGVVLPPSGERTNGSVTLTGISVPNGSSFRFTMEVQLPQSCTTTYTLTFTLGLPGNLKNLL